MAIIPKDKKWNQGNDGTSSGNLFASWNIDLDENPGKLRVSNRLKNIFDTTDAASFDGYVGAFAEYNNYIWGLSDVVIRTQSTSTDDITAGWEVDPTSGTPTLSNTNTDIAVFDSLLLAYDSTDIVRYNGTNWASWWVTTLGQSALSSTGEHILTVGSDGNLFIVDAGQKVYRVTPAGVVTKTGDGTLDFSATPYQIINAIKTSSRIFYGTEDDSGENAVIIEWDMSPSNNSANRIHNLGVKRILCLATWNDTPIAILSDGSIKYFDGASFVNWKGAKLPKTKLQYASDTIDKNGWDIIDNLPHFLINPQIDNLSGDSSTNYSESTGNYWNYPAGIYCLDPEKGLYCRYALTDGDDLGSPTIRNAGSLFARTNQKTKFLASYQTFTDGAVTAATHKAVLAAEDGTNNLDSRAWVILNPIESYDDVIKKITAIHKRLGTGDSINVYYRRFDEDSVKLNGSWSSATEFNTTDTSTGIDNDWVVFTKGGTYPGFVSTIQDVDTSSSTVTVITTKDSNSGITAGDTDTIECVNFKKMATITNTTIEWSELAIPDTTKSRHLWLWFEFKQAAGNKIELDYIITGT